jgi:hypothetical protein
MCFSEFGMVSDTERAAAFPRQGEDVTEETGTGLQPLPAKEAFGFGRGRVAQAAAWVAGHADGGDSPTARLFSPQAEERLEVMCSRIEAMVQQTCARLEAAVAPQVAQKTETTKVSNLPRSKERCYRCGKQGHRRTKCPTVRGSIQSHSGSSPTLLERHYSDFRNFGHRVVDCPLGTKKI